jgi:hypothetical protein
MSAENNPAARSSYFNGVAPGSRMVDPALVDPASPLPGFDQLYGMSFYEYLEAHPAEWEQFNLKMDADARATLPPESFERLPLPETGTVIDLGGGLGYVAEQIKRVRPDLRSVLCELPFVCEQAVDNGARVDKVLPANIWSDILPPAASYVMRRLLHDFQDEDCLKLLKNVRRAVPPEGSRLLIIDTLLDEDRQGPTRARQQLQSMELLFKSRQHTFSELQLLLRQSGWLPEPEPISLSPDMSCVVANA